jgi:sugar/nucleoside kinase (ribokinase family)
MARPVIAVAGAASVDMNIRRIPLDWVGQAGRDHYTPDMVRSLVDPPEMGLGGNGGAAAYVMGRLGMQVLLNGPIGDDPAGWLVRQWLEEGNVRCVGPSGPSTMFSVTPVDEKSNRLVCLQHASPRVDWRRSFEHEKADWLLAAAHAQVEPDELEEVHQTLRGFRRRGGTTALDSGIGWIGTYPPEQMRACWAETDVLLGTLDELSHWTGASNPEEIARAALERGPRQVIIKMGAEGAAFQTAGSDYTHQPAIPIERTGVSVGAGDAFNGALIVRIIAGDDMDSAVRFAQSVAGKVVEIGRGVVGWGQTLQQ